MLRLYCKLLIIYPRESSSKWRRTGRAGRLLLCLKSCVLVLITSAFYVLLSWAFFSLKKESGCWKPNLHFVQSFYSFAFRNDNYMYFFLVFYFTRQKWCWFSIKEMCKCFCRVKKKKFSAHIPGWSDWIQKFTNHICIHVCRKTGFILSGTMSVTAPSPSPYQKLSHSQTFFLRLGHILCSFTVSLRRDTQSLNASLMRLAPCWS